MYWNPGDMLKSSACLHAIVCSLQFAQATNGCLPLTDSDCAAALTSEFLLDLLLPLPLRHTHSCQRPFPLASPPAWSSCCSVSCSSPSSTCLGSTLAVAVATRTGTRTCPCRARRVHLNVRQQRRRSTTRLVSVESQSPYIWRREGHAQLEINSFKPLQAYLHDQHNLFYLQLFIHGRGKCYIHYCCF